MRSLRVIEGSFGETLTARALGEVLHASTTTFSTPGIWIYDTDESLLEVDASADTLDSIITWIRFTTRVQLGVTLPELSRLFGCNYRALRPGLEYTTVRFECIKRPELYVSARLLTGRGGDLERAPVIYLQLRQQVSEH